MSWMWTDDLARFLMRGNGRGPADRALEDWIERPVAIRVTDADQRSLGLAERSALPAPVEAD